MSHNSFMYPANAKERIYIENKYCNKHFVYCSIYSNLIRLIFFICLRLYIVTKFSPFIYFNIKMNMFLIMLQDFVM